MGDTFPNWKCLSSAQYKIGIGLEFRKEIFTEGCFSHAGISVKIDMFIKHVLVVISVSI